MEKVVRTIFLTLVVLAVSGVANADYTVTVYDTVGAPTGKFATNYPTVPPTPQLQWYTGDNFGWTHSWSAPTINPGDVLSITAAGLEIDAWDVDAQEFHLVKVDGANLGFLQTTGNNVYGLSTFDLLAFGANLDGSLSMFFDPASDGDYLDITALGYSKFSITYSVDEPEPEPEPEPPVVPAPAAVVLGSLGAGLVGWLRRRSIV